MVKAKLKNGKLEIITLCEDDAARTQNEGSGCGSVICSLEEQS